jgi:nitrate reductase gamma subunit
MNFPEYFLQMVERHCSPRFTAVFVHTVAVAVLIGVVYLVCSFVLFPVFNYVSSSSDIIRLYMIMIICASVGGITVLALSMLFYEYIRPTLWKARRRASEKTDTAVGN